MSGVLAAAVDRIRRNGGDPRSMVLAGRWPEPFVHYPDGDLYDPDSRAQAYFHVHRDGEQGHWHLFLRLADGPCHLGAVGLGRDGWPDHLFATNRWVTGEAWRGAATVAGLLTRFRLDVDGPAAPVGAWLTALVALHRADLARLARRRDRALARWTAAHPGRGDVRDCADLEVVATLALASSGSAGLP